MSSLSNLYLDRAQSRRLADSYPVYPAVGLLASIFCTLCAINLIPENPQPAGALFVPALVMVLGLLAAPALACARSPRAILRAENLLVLTPVYWLLLDLLQGAYPMEDVTPPGIEGAFIAVGLFSCGVWLAVMTRPLRLPPVVARSAAYTVEPKIIFLLIFVFFALAMVRFAYPAGFNPVTMVTALTEARWSAPWSRGQLGGWDAFLDHMSYFGYLLPVLTVLLAHHSKSVNSRVVVSFILSLVMTAFLAQGGARRIVGVIWGAAIICWVLQQERINFKKIVAAAAGVAVLLVAMQLILEYRNTGLQALTEEEKHLQYDYLHVDDNFLRLGQIIDIVPERHPYTYEKQIVYYAVRPIPRVLWPGKPVDPGFDLPSTLGKEGVSLSSSAIGEFYLAFGWLAVLLGGWVYGKLANSVSVLLVHMQGSSAVLVYSLAVMVLVAAMRSMVELVLMSYTILAWVVVTRILLIRRGRTLALPSEA
jgi:oligosaccharide repeat unit polymerase